VLEQLQAPESLSLSWYMESKLAAAIQKISILLLVFYISTEVRDLERLGWSGADGNVWTLDSVLWKREFLLTHPMLFFGRSDDQFIARFGMRNGGDAMSFMKKGSHCIVLDSRLPLYSTVITLDHIK
jgi:hypothetical protein